MKKIMNMAIQVLPFAGGEPDYGIIDAAIEQIQNSQLKYKVCPFETVVEGKYDELMNLVKKIHEVCYDNGANKMLVYLKILGAKDKDIFFVDRIEKF